MDQTPIADMKFEHALSELESIVAQMEDGHFELDAAIAAFQRGTVLLKHCESQLDVAENHLRVFENGQLQDVDRQTLETP